MQQEKNTTAEFDPLDMNNYKIEKLPKMKKSTFKSGWLVLVAHWRYWLLSWLLGRRYSLY